MYHSLIRARMKEEACRRCGQSLEAASITWAEDGSTFDDLGLSDESAALALSATEHLSVFCAGCGARGDIGTYILRLPPPIGVDRQIPWNPHAVDLYRSLIGGRLKERVCASCDASLAHAVVVQATGGVALNEQGLSDEAAARLLASTQRLSVQCLQCGTTADI